LKPSPSEDIEGWELVYVLERAQWRQGHGTELAETVTRFGLESLGLPRVYATVDMENKGSVEVLRRLGYEHLRDRVKERAVVGVFAREAPEDPVADTLTR